MSIRLHPLSPAAIGLALLMAPALLILPPAPVAFAAQAVPAARAVPVAERDIAFSLPKLSYTAERRVADGHHWQSMRVYYRPGMERMELEGDAAAGNVIIARFDRPVPWVLMPQLHLYIELPGEVSARFQQLLAGLRLMPEGPARIEGTAAEKYRVTGSLTGTLWLDRQGIPLRIQGQTMIGGRSTPADLEQSDVRIGAVSPDLFELPQGYSRITLNDPDWVKLLQRYLPDS